MLARAIYTSCELYRLHGSHGTEQPRAPIVPAQLPEQRILGPHAPPATTCVPGLPPPETEWANSKTTHLWGLLAPPIQPSRGVPVSPTQAPGTSLGNGSPGIPEDMIARSKAAVPSAPPLPELELSLEYIPARDAGDTSRESQTHHPFVEHCISSHLQPNLSCRSAIGKPAKE